MGTRAIILVTGPHRQGQNLPQTVRLYRHHDGGPDWTLKDIAGGARAAERLRSAQVRRWGDPRYDYTPAGTLADCVIAASVGWGGAAVRPDADRPDGADDAGAPAVYARPLAPEHYGARADLEWAYVVDARRRSVTVYGGYGNAESLMASGPQGPEAYLRAVRAEYRAAVRRRIRAGVRALVVQGWAVNPDPAPVREAGAARGAGPPEL